VNECIDQPFCTVFAPSVYHRASPGSFQLLGSSQPFGGNATAITAKGSNNVVLATEAGVFFWDGSSWNATSITASSPISAVRYCGSMLYAVDTSGVWYSGTSSVLTRKPAITLSPLRALHCPNDMVEWTAGDGVLFEQDGAGGWMERSSMSVNQAPWLAVWSPGPGEAWAFGAASYGVYWNTEDLILIDSPGGVQPDRINGMWGSTVDNLYAVGVVSQPFSFGMGVRFDGAQWTLIDTGSQRELLSIDGAAPLNVWLGSKGGGILRGVAPP
jgi:hypothetical protein